MKITNLNKILTSNLRVHLNLNFRESGLHTYMTTLIISAVVSFKLLSVLRIFRGVIKNIMSKFSKRTIRAFLWRNYNKYAYTYYMKRTQIINFQVSLVHFSFAWLKNICFEFKIKLWNCHRNIGGHHGVEPRGLWVRYLSTSQTEAFLLDGRRIGWRGTY